MKKILLFLILMLTFNTIVSAASMCSSEEKLELNQKAANIKVKYEVAEETIPTVDYPMTIQFINIKLTNMSEEFYVNIKSDNETFNQSYYYSNSTDGILNIRWDNLDEVTTFTITVYTTDKTGCPNEKFKTIYLTTPRYNELSENYQCVEYEDFYLCAEFVTFKEVSQETFDKEIEQYIKKLNKTPIVENDGDEKTDNKLSEIIADYKWYFIGAFAIILGISIVVIIAKKKKFRELGL